ncbi:MAG: putative F420-dependent enzyme [Frankiales bacterium]|jgi:PPOX class probable F420-dependent enzyme|nr:putative F420-dependent enzyme [Frankiales bacterium]
MDLTSALDFVRDHPRAVLATLKHDSSPQLSPVVVGVDDDGRVVVSTRETAYKVKNVRRDPRVWLCVLDEKFFGQWVQLEGTVEVLSLPDAMQPLVDYYRRLSGEHPDWDDYRATMELEQRCLLQITPTAAGPDVSG